MGISITGFATKADEQKIIRSIVSALHQENRKAEIVFDSEQPFDGVMLRKPGDDFIDIYSGDKGSVCTVSNDIQERHLWLERISKLYDLFYFDISETSMEHRFALYSGGAEKMAMNVYDLGSKKRIVGENFLNIQDDRDIFTGTFSDALNDYLPKPLGDMMDMGYREKVRRYRLNIIEEKKEEPVKEKQIRSRLLDVVPVLILTGFLIHTIWVRFDQGILLSWHHWLALALTAGCQICFRKNNQLGVLTTGICLLAGLTGLAQFSPGVSFSSFHWTPGSADIPLFYGQPVFLIWLGLHLLLSGRYYNGVLQRKYWTKFLSTH